MKYLKMVAVATLLTSAVCAHADEFGTVISTTAIQKQFPVNQQVCQQQQVQTQRPKSGAGAVMGGIAGGVIGNQIGRGDGNALATAIGIVGGAVLGDKIEGQPTPQTQIVENCMTQVVYETRVVGYQVVYEYAGKRYSTELKRDPGAMVRLQVVPSPNQ